MGGPSRQSAENEARLKTWARLQELCPPGWTVEGGRFRPTETPHGYWLRRQTVSAGCARSDCRRRCELDLEDLIRSPHAHEPLAHVVAGRLRCAHWRGCRLELRPSLYPEGVPIICFALEPEAYFEIGCVSCPSLRRMTPIEVIDGLRRSRRGDGGMGIHVLVDRIRGPCPNCGGRRFFAKLVQRAATQASK